MRDIPFFTTHNGVAGLSLKEIPYTACAYIRVLDTSNFDELLKECVDFCKAAGAEQIFVTGHASLEKYQLHTVIVRMSCEKNKIPQVGAVAVPVTNETLEQWQEIYNNKMRDVPNATYMSVLDCQRAAEKGILYFVFEESVLIGIGSIDAESIGAVATVIPGKGSVVLSALCKKVATDEVSFEVASENRKAMRLYKSMGFHVIEECSRWYRIE